MDHWVCKWIAYHKMCTSLVIFFCFPSFQHIFFSSTTTWTLDNSRILSNPRRNTVQRHLQTHIRLVIMMLNNHLQLYQSRRKVPGLPTRSRMRFTRPRTRLIVTIITMTNKQRIMNSIIARSKTKDKELLFDLG